MLDPVAPYRIASPPPIDPRDLIRWKRDVQAAERAAIRRRRDGLLWIALGIAIIQACAFVASLIVWGAR